ncbi:PPOX class F420-dependent oxidoreductase [Sciscionella sediminilitoris]|uniref:PPOX class F420-dependent oxidoreductase n=1 Tax=Sciscionella sediminilitoris TaxID=1445613 RepID=UPI0004DF679A|nr:PPOX class F420-dependent oxidoreductase [Sciscionella sp. SE31]
MPSEADYLALVARRDQGVLATLRRAGTPQLSTVNYAFYPEERLLRVSTITSLAKVANLRRDPRAGFHVASEDGWSYTALDVTAELSPVAESPEDTTVEELVRVYRDILGEHPDWADYRAAMVADRRLVLRLRIQHAYGRV